MLLFLELDYSFGDTSCSVFAVFFNCSFPVNHSTFEKTIIVMEIKCWIVVEIISVQGSHPWQARCHRAELCLTAQTIQSRRISQEHNADGAGDQC